MENKQYYIGDGWFYIKEADTFILNNGEFVIPGSAYREKIKELFGEVPPNTLIVHTKGIKDILHDMYNEKKIVKK